MEFTQLLQIIREQYPTAIVQEQTAALVITPESLLEVVTALKNGKLAFESLHCISGVDRKENFEVVYHLYSFNQKIMLTLKVILPRDNPQVESLAHLFRSADWLEREVYDLFGITFTNHPDLRRILNPDEWTTYPLRKDFSHPDFIRKPETLGLKGGA